jgi:hypothetical protein
VAVRTGVGLSPLSISLVVLFSSLLKPIINSVQRVETGATSGAGLNEDGVNRSGVSGSGASGHVVEADVFVFFEALGASFTSQA